jgi:hypothetical protein
MGTSVAEIVPRPAGVQTLRKPLPLDKHEASGFSLVRNHKHPWSGPACDGWMFLARGIPTVYGYGVTYGGVHGADEWVDLESLRRVTEVYALTILSYLSRNCSAPIISTAKNSPGRRLCL